ncbi:MAG: manganese efflux pump MntP family protein [Bacteroidota bacterium]|nr:manganese efflux pump MntP family protein [Bacteroidota bacterium]
MDFLTILLTAFALAMDAFAVALSAGAVLVRASARQTFRLSFHFGFFQFFMPIVGWAAGKEAVQFISSYDHWVAFAMLAVVGGKMVYESFERERPKAKGDMTRGTSLLILSLATSIDSLAVGLSFGLLRIPIILPSMLIGIVTAGMTFAGMRLGERFSRILGKRVELAGGIILIGIGVRILLEHLS